MNQRNKGLNILITLLNFPFYSLFTLLYFTSLHFSLFPLNPYSPSHNDSNAMVLVLGRTDNPPTQHQSRQHLARRMARPSHRLRIHFQARHFFRLVSQMCRFYSCFYYEPWCRQQIIIATAQVFFHRFYLRESFKKYKLYVRRRCTFLKRILHLIGFGYGLHFLGFKGRRIP